MNHRQMLSLILGLVLLLGQGLVHAEWPGSRYQLKSPDGQVVTINTINQKREADSLVLYTSEYGPSSRTNPYGVEVAAVPVPGKANTYKVTRMTSIFTCESDEDLKKCGNMSIPPNGVVLSAMGNQREWLLKTLPMGAEFEVSQALVSESRFSISAVNPTPQTNPTGSGFPGTRGGNQMILYDSLYGQPTTGTNEFGYEVTVKEGRVIAQEGANSVVPAESGAFVLSGHGKARQWLLQNAPIGSKISLDNNTVISTIDKETYLYQLERLVSKIEALQPAKIPSEVKQKIQTLRQTAYILSDQEVSEKALALKQQLTPVLWQSYPTVSSASMRAVWHRPSEASLAEIRQSLDLLQKAGFNTIFLETYLHGDPIFKSRTFETYNIPQKLPFVQKDGDRDLLKTWLDEAHKRGMKVHVWFQTFYAGNRQFDKSMGSILTTYPQWANIQRSGLGQATLPASTLESGAYFLDPMNQEVQQFLLTLIDEIITRYPIDGFQLDYIRYPASFPQDRFSYVATTWGYTPFARKVFQDRFGKDPAELTPAADPELWAEWNNFKTRQIDRFVRKVRDDIKEKRPDMPLSVAIFPKVKESIERKHQNWLSWAQNGWVDFIAPMTLTSSLESIATDTREVQTGAAVPVITGIFGPFNGNNPTDVVDQVWTAFQAGAKGVAVFDTAHLTRQMAEALNMGLFKIEGPKKQK